MSTKQIKKRCCYCRKVFTSDPRVGRQQKTCKNPVCRQKRRKASQQRWVKKNRNYFKGRYAATLQWLSEHPGYLKSYRQSHPEYVDKNRIRQKGRRANIMVNPRVDIQDAIITQPSENINDSLRFVAVDIQDTNGGQVIVPVYVNDNLWPVDIQDKMVKRGLNGYTSAMMIPVTRIGGLLGVWMRRRC